MLVTKLQKLAQIILPMKEKEKMEMKEKMEAYCFKCRAKREIQNAKVVTLKNDRPATEGVCPRCGTKVFRIMASLK